MENNDVLNQVSEIDSMDSVESVDSTDSMYSMGDEYTDSTEAGGYIESKPLDLSMDAMEGMEENSLSERSLETPGSNAKKLLDAISEPDPGEEAALKKAEARTALPKTPEQEEAELLDGVKSERGRERIKNIINARKEAEAKLSDQESRFNSLRELIDGTGMEVEELVKTVEFGSLVRAGDENSLLIALNMVEEQRENICKRLGIAAPGVNLLSDFPELQEAVRKREITPEHAAKLAKYQRSEREQQKSMQIKQSREQETRQHQDLVMQASQTAMAYLATRRDEADFSAKLERMEKYFRDPGKLQEFVKNYEPKLWFAQLKFMYENISVPQTRSPAFSQPIRSRPVMSGSVAPNPNASTAERLMGHLDNLGI